jgi:DNA-binding protein HU-beta
MTKKDMVGAIVKETGCSKKDAEAMVIAYENALIGAIKDGDSYRINGLGTITKVTRAARRGRNPRTGEEIQIPASVAVKIKTSKTFAE